MSDKIQHIKTMKTIDLPCFGIQLTVDTDKPSGGSIVHSPDLYETCPHCGQRECLYSCDDSQGAAGDGNLESEETVASRHQYNGAVDGITSMILAHACAGIDVESPAYLEGIETAVQAIGNNLG